MSGPSANRINGDYGRDDREMELLAAYALGVLDDHEAREVDLLLARAGRAAAESFEIAAAATLVATVSESIEPMPAAVRANLKAFGRTWAKHNMAAAAGGRQPAASIAGERSGGPAETRDRAGVLRLAAWTGWLAAAACLAVAATAWLPLATQSSPSPGSPGAPGAPGNSWLRAEPGMPQSALATVRAQLAERGRTMVAAWAPLETPDPTAAGPDVGGEVLWNNETQCGVMRFTGLAANDPSEFQYQLWIFDAEQEHPIDGGVFDIPAGSEGREVLTAVNAKLHVEKPTMFAITVEKPGGVVVSDRSRIALLGANPAPTGAAHAGRPG